jgi:steroid 5-alpha reductase family enzyme
LKVFYPLDLIYILILVFTSIWMLSVKLKNVGIVDLLWAIIFSLIAIYFFWNQTGWLPRSILFLLMVSLHSIRLFYHLYRRFMRNPEIEDPRYHQYRVIWGPQKADLLFLGVFYWQLALVVLLTVPWTVVFENTLPSFSPFEYMALSLWLVGFLGESIADAQLTRFRISRSQKESELKEVCQSGLWKYSRHPNYFFEWLMWCSYALFTGKLWAFYSPITIFIFLVWITGIAPTESRLLTSKGDAYKAYQKKTSVFIPWFPRRVP